MDMIEQKMNEILEHCKKKKIKYSMDARFENKGHIMTFYWRP